MKMKTLFKLVAILCSLTYPSWATWTLLNSGPKVNNGSGSGCSVTTPSTGSGHVGVYCVTFQTVSTTTLSGVANGGSWTVSTLASTWDSGTLMGVSCAYTLSTTSGATSIVGTITNSGAAGCAFWELSGTLGGYTYDTGNTIVHAGSAGSWAAPALTLGTSNNYILIQVGNNYTTNTLTAINLSYNLKQDAFSDGYADLINVSSYTAPTWTLGGGNGSLVGGALAIYEGTSAVKRHRASVINTP